MSFNLSIDEFRARHTIPSSITDDMVQSELHAAEFAVELYLGYDPVASTRTQYFDGDGTDRLAVGPFVTAITTIHENWEGYYTSSNFTADELLTVEEHYVLEVINGRTSGVVRRVGTIWPYRRKRGIDRLASEKTECYGCIKIVFTAGLSPPEMHLIRLSAYDEANAVIKTYPNSFGIVMSDSIDGASVSVTPFPPKKKDHSGLISAVAKERLARLKRPVIA